MIMSTTIKDETQSDDYDDVENVSDLPFSPSTLEKKHRLQAQRLCKPTIECTSVNCFGH